LYDLLPEAVWVSDTRAIDRAENKMLQLLIAQRLGFMVPETLLGSSPALAQAFVSKHGTAIVKSHSGRFTEPDERGEYMELYATHVQAGDDLSYDGLSVGPVMFQTLIRPKREYRVTVVANQVFPAAVELNGMTEPKIQDWHRGYLKGTLQFTNCELPAAVRVRCVRLVHELGLNYGALDLIEDEQGVFWFVEINPNGQWGFIEHETGQPIGAALAALLERRSAAKASLSRRAMVSV
jgi:glutathione synthase/RimK-type ligase-like ATP-grasp enzyme